MLGISDANTLMMMGFIVTAAGFFGGTAMNSVLEEDGFGVVGNMLILIAGAFIGMQMDGIVRLPFDVPVAQAVRAITGAFLCLIALSLAKNVLRRLGL